MIVPVSKENEKEWIELCITLWPDAIANLKGDMEIVTDIALKEKFWDSKYKGAYEQGTFTDPDFCVLRFTPKTGRLYANFTIADFEF